MKLKRLPLLLVPFMMLGCNSGSVNKTKSPFSDTYEATGMKGKYTIASPIDSDDEYNLLRTSIKNYKDNTDDYLVSSYTREEHTRDLKAAYFGKNLGAANLCSLTDQTTVNTRYVNHVTTKFTTAHKENQTVSGGINKTNPVVNDYIHVANYETEGEQPYQTNQLLKNDGEEDIIKTKINPSTVNLGDKDAVTNVFGLKPYEQDIQSNFGDIERREQHITFKVLDDNNNAVYGKTSDGKYLIKEATSLFVPYSTTVGDTYKAVDNFFYEAILEKVGDKFRFTNFRFYTELLILSEAYTDETKIPVLYLEKPQLVEYSEINYTIEYTTSLVNEFNKKDIPGWVEP